MVDIETVSVSLAALSVVLGVIYYILNLRDQKRNMKLTLETRQAQLFMQINAQWRDRDFIKRFYDMLNNWKYTDVKDFWSKYGQDVNEDAFVTMVEIGWYFESVGQLLRDGLIDVKLVDAMYSDRLIRLWEKSYTIIEGLRKVHHNPDYYGNYEYLYKELKRRQVRSGTPYEQVSP